MTPDLEHVPFDHFQRYATAAKLLQSLPKDARVLEVGSGQVRTLADFVDNKQMIFSDVTFSPAPNGAGAFVQAEATALPFGADVIDAVVCLDVMEHVPRPLRTGVTTELARVARNLVIIACPLDMPWVHAAEARANEIWRASFGSDYPWLEEHSIHGLVVADEIEAALVAGGMTVFRFPHGNIRTWQSLMSAHFVKEAVHELKPLVATADRLYNHSVFEGDRVSESYREFFVAARNPEDLDRLRAAIESGGKKDEAATELLDGLGETLHAANRKRQEEMTQIIAERDAALANVENLTDQVMQLTGRLEFVEARLERIRIAYDDISKGTPGKTPRRLLMQQRWRWRMVEWRAYFRGLLKK